MNGGEFISFAGKLAMQTSHGPAGYRSAVSRAYYGAFHIARAYLNAFQFHCHSGSNEHQWVQHHFQNCTTQTARDIGQSLANLHESRKVADYKLDKVAADRQSNAESCVLRADGIRDNIKECSNPALIATIKAEMVAYRQKVNLA